MIYKNEIEDVGKEEINEKDYELEVDINNAVNYLCRFIIDFNDCSYELSRHGLSDHIEY